MIRIRSKQHNFRRCGIPHPKDPVEYPDGRFSAAELKILKAEPMLIVEEVAEIKGTVKESAPPSAGPIEETVEEAKAEGAPDVVEKPAPAKKPAGKKGKK